jgi:hypothetical protein
MAALHAEPLALCLRLLLRKRQWHAVARLAYSDVPDPAAAVAALAAGGLARLDLEVSRAADLSALLGGLPADTLRAALLQLLPARHPAAAGGAKGSKQLLVEATLVGSAGASLRVECLGGAG